MSPGPRGRAWSCLSSHLLLSPLSSPWHCPRDCGGKGAGLLLTLHLDCVSSDSPGQHVRLCSLTPHAPSTRRRHCSRCPQLVHSDLTTPAMGPEGPSIPWAWRDPLRPPETRASSHARAAGTGGLGGGGSNAPRRLLTERSLDVGFLFV